MKLEDRHPVINGKSILTRIVIAHSGSTNDGQPSQDGPARAGPHHHPQLHAPNDNHIQPATNRKRYQTHSVDQPRPIVIAHSRSTNHGQPSQYGPTRTGPHPPQLRWTGGSNHIRLINHGQPSQDGPTTVTRPWWQPHPIHNQSNLSIDFPLMADVHPPISSHVR